MRNKRPEFPKRAVVTAGMPYGNKQLHFGHIGGVFIHADTYYRFLQDRIGAENVIFVSGTDCYGSPSVQSYKEYYESSENPVGLSDYVKGFYRDHLNTLENYQVRPSFFAASAFGEGGSEHASLSAKWFNELYERGDIYQDSSLQFYDSESESFLNGRQVLGRCPIEGCGSERGYADECSLGHQYDPKDLIEPVSAVSGAVPELREVRNWYFDLPAYMEKLKTMIDELRRLKRIRPTVYSAIDEFLKPPVIYVKREDHEQLVDKMQGQWLYDDLNDEPKKPSVVYVYSDLDSREKGRKILSENGMQYRTGKTLVPFRLTGNVEWGVPVPNKDGINDATFWVWPESLWAPVSFTKAHLKMAPQKLQDINKWWFDRDAAQYQFIGEDNVYFYCIPQSAMVMSHMGIKPDSPETMDPAYYQNAVANAHLLFMGRKASSSDDVPPPLADELLEYYTADQLRMHFLGLGLSKRSSSFSPAVFDPEYNPETSGPDPVLKDGNLLTNVYNRILRSCFYTAEKETNCRIPGLEPSSEINKILERAVTEYERNMQRHEFHLVIYAVDDAIRKVSKHWAKHTRNTDDYSQILADCFYASKVIALLLHPITPDSAENIRQMMCLDDSLWDWKHVLEPIQVHMVDPKNHRITAIPPRYDFYKRHESQLQGIDRRKDD